MSVYVNGTLASTVTGVSDQFYMPSGAGFLGANASGGEAMTGTIHRVTVYPMVEEETDIQRNAEAFTAAVLPGATSFTRDPAHHRLGRFLDPGVGRPATPPACT